VTKQLEGGAVSARDARTGPARDRATSRRGRRVGTARAPRAAAHPSARRSPGRSTGAPDGPARVDDLVVGTVPRTARVTGVLLLLAAVTALVALFPTYLVVNGQELSSGGSVGRVLAGLLVPAASAAVGVGLVRGAVPKFGLAYAGVAGALSLGQLLIELYRGSSSTSRPGVEVLAGHRVLTSGVEVGAGWVLGVVALGLTVLAGITAVMAWGRTVMDDGGTLDPVRSGLAGAATLLGVGTVLCLSLPAADVPDQLVTDPSTGLQTVVPRQGPQALLERPGLALLGGLLLAGALVLCSVVAPSLRPRLAVVGGLLAIAVTVLTAGLSGVRDAASDELVWTVPGLGLLVAGLAYAVLTVLAWRIRRGVRS
jgi:hypothetical protein